MICKVSKQDGSGVVEEDEMKSIHSPYSISTIYFYLHSLSQTKNPKIKLPIYLLNPSGYDTS